MRQTRNLTLVNVTVRKLEPPSTVALAAPPVSFVHASSVGKHETLVAICRGSEIRNAVVPVAFSTDGKGRGGCGTIYSRNIVLVMTTTLVRWRAREGKEGNGGRGGTHMRAC